MAAARQWPADRIERWPIEKLIPYARNARTHSEAQIAQLAAAIDEFGWTMPLLVDPAGNIIAGHGRVLAAKSLGIDSIPVMIAVGWTPAQIRAYTIADNQLALNAGWNMEVLGEEVRGLVDDIDLSLLGFGDAELAALTAEPGVAEGLTDPDQAPAIETRIVSALGDVWQLGRHRLMCGDATDAFAVRALLHEVHPFLMITDPPYGVEYEAAWRAEVNHDGPNSKRAVGKVTNDDRADWREAWALFPGAVVYVWHAAWFASESHASLTACAFKIRNQIVWAKDSPVFSRGHYHWQHEPCWYAVRDGASAEWSGDRTQSTIWTIEHLKSETGHSTQKPVDCMRRPMMNHGAAGTVIYDPFCGSGTTLIAAEQSARIGYAMEINPAYVDVAVRRWQAFTGQRAVRADGVPFDSP